MTNDIAENPLRNTPVVPTTGHFMESLFFLAALALVLTWALPSLHAKYLVIQGCSGPLESLSDNYSTYIPR